MTLHAFRTVGACYEFTLTYLGAAVYPELLIIFLNVIGWSCFGLFGFDNLHCEFKGEVDSKGELQK